MTSPSLKGRVAWAISEASVAEIDDLNILRASLLAMSRAVRDLTMEFTKPDAVLVDGCNRPPELLAPGERWTRGPIEAPVDKSQKKLESFFTKRAPEISSQPTAAAEDMLNAKEELIDDTPGSWPRPRRVEAVIEGDGMVPSISAASILAKVHRDHVMDELHRKYPVYGFDTHKGYGTSAHTQAIEFHGVCPEHRRSFGPVRQALGLPPIDKSIPLLLVGQKQLSFGNAASAKVEKAPASTNTASTGGDASTPDVFRCKELDDKGVDVDVSTTPRSSTTTEIGARRGRGKGRGRGKRQMNEVETPPKKRQDLAKHNGNA